jgi:hypothetical protein
MHVTPLHLDVAHHFRQTCAALTGAALFGPFSAAPRQGPRRRGPLLLNKKNCRASMICITICISFCFHLCKMAKPKMQWRLRWFWNTARFAQGGAESATIQGTCISSQACALTSLDGETGSSESPCRARVYSSRRGEVLVGSAEFLRFCASSRT